MEQAVNKRFVIIGCKDTDKEAIARPTITYGQDAWRRLKKNPIAMISLGVLVLMAITMIREALVEDLDILMGRQALPTKEFDILLLPKIIFGEFIRSIILSMAIMENRLDITVKQLSLS